jgi:hypothetical protein
MDWIVSGQLVRLDINLWTASNYRALSTFSEPCQWNTRYVLINIRLEKYCTNLVIETARNDDLNPDRRTRHETMMYENCDLSFPLPHSLYFFDTPVRVKPLDIAFHIFE